MFTEILKIVPKMDNADLERMRKAVQSRFTKVAKSFGSGVVAALKGGGIMGAGLALIDKLLNPLKETQEAIDRTLKSGDDAVTNAKQFNTTAGKLLKLQAFAQSSGLDADSLSMLITKFQTAVAEAQNDPTKVTSVRNFAGIPDTAEAFFQFIQALQKMDKSQQLLVQQEVFGEKQILKMSDFLNSDFANIGKYFSKFSSDRLTSSANKIGGLNDLSDTLAAVRGLEDIQNKAQVISKGMIEARDLAERQALERENMRIRSYQDLQAISTTADKIFTLVEEGVGMLGKLINFLTPAVNRVLGAIEKLMGSRLFKGFNLFGGEDK